MAKRPPAKRRIRQLATASAAIAISLTAGFIVAEAGTRAIRGNAWPYLNIFVSDPTYGVRLLPNAKTKTRTRTGNITNVATNARGFRGPDWPTHSSSRKRLLVLGDSQTFGYGVEQEQTFCATLERELDVDVLCAAVPTWGPTEFEPLLQTLAAEGKPDVVLWMANVANDWRETHVANRRRTTERDGWARRVNKASSNAFEFPARRWLLSRSQLVFLVRETLALSRANLRSENVANARAALAPSGAAALVRDLPRLRMSPDGNRSKMTASILRARSICRHFGCTLVVAGLPVDVQVDAHEWEKYRDQPASSAKVGATRVLIGELLTELYENKVSTVDLFPALKQASPGAFLTDDPHLSAQGHAAVARALTPTLASALRLTTPLTKPQPRHRRLTARLHNSQQPTSARANALVTKEQP